MQPGNARIIQANVHALAAANGGHDVAERKNLTRFPRYEGTVYPPQTLPSIGAVSKVLPLRYPPCHGPYREITCRNVVHRGKDKA